MKSMAILLAGGASRRMRRDKPLLELNGETLVARHWRQLRQVGIREAIVICNRGNREGLTQALASHTGPQFVLQEGGDMTRAVRIGLRAAAATETLYVVCVNDLILDSDYAKIEACGGQGADIAIPARILDRTFIGGYLELVPRNRRVRVIVEKPAGGCPPGSAANIMVHRIAGRAWIERLAAHLDSGDPYEAALNRLISAGAAAMAVWVDFWIAIKTPADFERARRRLER